MFFLAPNNAAAVSLSEAKAVADWVLLAPAIVISPSKAAPPVPKAPSAWLPAKIAFSIALAWDLTIDSLIKGRIGRIASSSVSLPKYDCEINFLVESVLSVKSTPAPLAGSYASPRGSKLPFGALPEAVWLAVNSA